MKKILFTTLLIAALPVQVTFATETALSSAEKADLLLMREEEKLAYDVYTTLGEKYDFRVFTNIPRSEARHMDAMADLLKQYHLEDPIKNDKIGIFDNPKLAELYNKLIEQGGDELSALKVGAEIEELDIADLMKAVETSEKVDIDAVYDNLLRGSRNHLRAFMRQINKLGESYQPKYISQALFDEIINGEREKGNGHRKE